MTDKQGEMAKVARTRRVGSGGAEAGHTARLAAICSCARFVHTAPDWQGISDPQGSSRCNNPCSTAAKHGLLLRRRGRWASQLAAAVPRPHAAGGARPRACRRRLRCSGQQRAGARCTARMRQASPAHPHAGLRRWRSCGSG